MLRTLKTLLLAAALVASTTLTAQAFTAGAVGPVSLQTGFPVWWQDDAGVRIGFCRNDNDATCLPDPIIPGNLLSQQIGYGSEAFWWMSNGTNGAVNLELAMEAAFLTGDAAPGQQFPFARIRLTGPVSAPGDWTVTGSGFNFVAVATDDGKGGFEFKNQGVDIPGTVTAIPPYSDLLPNSQITLFYGLGGNVVPANITITGPGIAQTITPAQFTLAAGRLFDSGTNLSPIANHDITATSVATPVTINLTANDVDPVGLNNVHGINLRAVGLGSALPFVFEPGDPANTATRGMATAKGGRVAKNPDGTVTYLPAPAFSGVDSFSYVIQDTGGCISGQATTPDPLAPANNICLPPTAATTFASALAIVTVEQATAQAAFRPKLQKWDVSGTSSVSALTTTDAAANPVLFTNLAGIQEVPPRTTAGSGEASVTLRTDAVLGQVIDYTLTFSGLVDVQQAHIHNGPVGANGPVNVFLCTNIGSPPGVPAPPACPATAGTVTGTLSAVDFIAAGAVTTFPELIAAIQAGNSYVNVHTVAFGGGEIRGQLGRNVVAVHSGPNTASPLLGVVAVPPLGGQTSTWTLPEKLSAIPSTDRRVTIQTSAGNVVTVPLQLK